MKNTFLALALLVSSGAFAQLAAPVSPASAAAAQAAVDATNAAADAVKYIPYADMSDVPQSKLDEAKALGEAVVRDMLNAYETRKTPEMEEFALKAKRRSDSIADVAMAADRANVLEFLGLDPAGDSGLFYFVSWSMPIEMLRSYAVEAMWSGGTMVFKGIPPGKELGKFITEDLRQLVYGKGAAANISLDPRLFDAYAVNAVPSIVFTTLKPTMQCQGISQIPVKTESGVAASYDVCPELDPSLFWKISGSITSSYALQTFIDDGAKSAIPYLNALARGWAGRTAPGKTQLAFTGKWEDVLSPSEKMVAKDIGNTMTQVPQPVKK